MRAAISSPPGPAWISCIAIVRPTSHLPGPALMTSTARRCAARIVARPRSASAYINGVKCEASLPTACAAASNHGSVRAEPTTPNRLDERAYVDLVERACERNQVTQVCNRPLTEAGKLL